MIRTAAQAGWVALNLLVATWSRLSVLHIFELRSSPTPPPGFD